MSLCWSVGVLDGSKHDTFQVLILSPKYVSKYFTEILEGERESRKKIFGAINLPSNLSLCPTTGLCSVVQNRLWRNPRRRPDGGGLEELLSAGTKPSDGFPLMDRYGKFSSSGGEPRWAVRGEEEVEMEEEMQKGGDGEEVSGRQPGILSTLLGLSTTRYISRARWRHTVFHKTSESCRQTTTCSAVCVFVVTLNEYYLFLRNIIWT